VVIAAMKGSFKPGQPVYHQRLGRGVVLEEWGAWLDVDDRGNELPINGKGIFEVKFSAGGQRSINGTFLQAAGRAGSARTRIVNGSRLGLQGGERWTGTSEQEYKLCHATADQFQ
jgi:hypothetical protein